MMTHLTTKPHTTFCSCHILDKVVKSAEEREKQEHVQTLKRPPLREGPN